MVTEFSATKECIKNNGVTGNQPDCRHGGPDGLLDSKVWRLNLVPLASFMKCCLILEIRGFHANDAKLAVRVKNKPLWLMVEAEFEKLVSR